MLAFDAKGTTLCSVGNDDDHLVVLWGWERGEALAHVQTHKEPVYGLCALPPPPGSAAAFVAVGKGYGRVFRATAAADAVTLDSGVPLKLAGRERSAAQLAVLADASVVTLGSDKGSLHQYTHADGKPAGKPVKDAHTGPIWWRRRAASCSRAARTAPSGCGARGSSR